MIVCVEFTRKLNKARNARTTMSLDLKIKKNDVYQSKEL